MVASCKDTGRQELATGKALANTAGDSLKHSLLAKNNQLRKVTLQQQRRPKGNVPLYLKKKAEQTSQGSNVIKHRRERHLTCQSCASEELNCDCRGV